MRYNRKRKKCNKNEERKKDNEIMDSAALQRI